MQCLSRYFLFNFGEDLVVFVKLHFAKLVATIAKMGCYLFSALIFFAKLREFYRSIEYVGSVALSEIGHIYG